jgi:hypothetical protein
MKTLNVLCLVAALSISGSACAVGAIAVVDEEGDSASEVGYYIVFNEDSESAAKKAALKDCRADGNKNCKIGVWFTKCGAYATSETTYGYGTGKTKGAAQQNALDGCGSGCKVVVADCE